MSSIFEEMTAELKSQRELEFPAEKCTSALKSRMKCSFCPSTFENYFSLAIHLKTDHRAKIKIQCKICQKLFINNLTFHKHLLNHVPGVTKELLDILDGGFLPYYRKKQAERENKLLQQRENQTEIKEQSLELLAESSERHHSDQANSGNLREKRKRRKIVCGKCDQVFKTEKEFATHSVSHVRIDTRINCSKCSNYFVRPDDYFGHSCLRSEIASEPVASSGIVSESPDQPSSPIFFQHSAPPSPSELIPKDPPPSQLISINNPPDLIEPENSVPSPPEMIPNSPDPPSSPVCFEDSQPSSPIPPENPQPTAEILTETFPPSVQLQNYTESAASTVDPAPSLLQNSPQHSSPMKLQAASTAPPILLHVPPPPVFMQLLKATSAPQHSNSDPDDEIHRILASLDLQESYECDLCPQKFQFKIPWVEHKLSHPENTDWLCRHCGMKCPTEVWLYNHMRYQHHDLDGDQTFMRNLRHAQKNPRKPYKCDICSKEFRRRRFLLPHQRTHPEHRDTLCFCGQEFATREERLAHYRVKHYQTSGLDTAVCELCGKSMRKRQLRKHLKLVHPSSQGTTFMCEHCGKTFETEGTYKYHKVSHRPEKPFKCKFDSYGCNHYVEMLGHLAYKHLGPRGFQEIQVDPGAEKSFKCTQCDQQYTTEVALNEHLIFHGERTHKCKKCPWKCFTSYHLHVHYLTFHSTGLSNMAKPTPWQYKYCNQTLGNRCELFFHEKKCGDRAEIATETRYAVQADDESAWLEDVQRTEDGRWKCGQCEKTFRMSQDLKYHYRAVHLKTFKFTCQVCSHGANSKGNMNAHMRKHGGAFACSDCGLRFGTWKERRDHQVQEGHAGSSKGPQEEDGVKSTSGEHARRGRSRGSSKFLDVLLGLDGEEGINVTLTAISKH